jgi:hypothetical protein
MATNNVLDAVLAQYESSKQSGSSSTSKMSQEERMKNTGTKKNSNSPNTRWFITI